jgi:hypothetical protein
MKKIVLAVVILLLLALTFPSIPKVSATTTEDLRRVTPALPDDVPREPMPENFTTEDYLNTTNPYSNLASAQGALGEVDDPEGSNPLYVLVFGDEEEREVTRSVRFNWEAWAKLQLERGDEALVANFGIDIRILGFLEWDSDDIIEYMDDPYEWDLCDELLADKGHYLRTWYDGEWWSNYVDAIIGLTAQSTPADDPPLAGVTSSLNELNQGIIFVLLKWQVYWKDDNLVQHEVSHLYYAPDHPESQSPPPCCAMAYHPHYQSWIWEDDLWWVFTDVGCVYTAYSWCTSCHQTIQQKSGRYPLRTLTISASSGGATNPIPGTYIYGNGSSVTVTASAYSGYVFNYWTLDGGTYYQNPITVTMDADHNLGAYFRPVTVQTRYFNNAPRTTNGLAACDLGLTLTVTQSVHTAGTSVTLQTGYWACDVSVRHADGSETVIGTKIAPVSRAAAGWAYLHNTWTCLGANFVSTDCVVVRVYAKIGSGSWVLQDTFVTEQLGASRLSSATWTVWYNVRINYAVPKYQYLYCHDVYQSADCEDKIDNFSWTPVMT